MYGFYMKCDTGMKLVKLRKLSEKGTTLIYRTVSNSKGIELIFFSSYRICGTLRDLVLFVRFKKHEKHPQRSVNFSKIAGLKLTLLHGCFSRFLNCTNGTKLRNAPHIRKYRHNYVNHSYNVYR